MIEINLVPENLRKKRKPAAAAGTAAPSKGFSRETFLAIIGGFLFVLVIFSIGLQVYISMKIGKRNELKKDSDQIASGKKNVDQLKKEMGELKAKVKTFEDAIGKKQVYIAQKLNVVSDSLPRGVWLTKIALEGKFFIVEGSAVSKNKSEITDIHALASSLRESKEFMANLKNLELDMIKARPVENNLSIADFTIKAEIDEK